MRINYKTLKNQMNWLPLLAVFLVTFTACQEDEGDVVEPVPTAYVAIYNAAPNSPELDVLVDNRQIFRQPLNYTDYTQYLNFYTGERALKVNSFNASSALVDTTINFQPDQAYSVFIADDLADLSAVVVEDNADTPAAGKALVRMIHLSPDAQAVDLVEEDGTRLFADQQFKQATDFVEVDANTYNLMLNATGSGDEVASIPDADFRSGGIYTVIVRGFATPPAGNANGLSVQIISNN